MRIAVGMLLAFAAYLITGGARSSA